MDERLKEGSAREDQDSGTKLFFDLQTAGISISSEENPITASKKRRWGDDGSVEAAMTDKELQGEDGGNICSVLIYFLRPLPEAPYRSYMLQRYRRHPIIFSWMQ